MSMIYNRAYKVPSWVVINLPKDQAKIVVGKFADHGAHEVKWVANSFLETVANLSSRGWRNEIEQKMPYFASVDFLNVAFTQHVRKYGENKMTSGTPDKPWNAMNRRIESMDDYTRLFNEMLENEPDITLSHMFDIGELCHAQGFEQIKTFVTVGPVATKALQKVSDRVITIGGKSDELDLTGVADDEIGQSAIEFVARQLGFVK